VSFFGFVKGILVASIIDLIKNASLQSKWWGRFFFLVNLLECVLQTNWMITDINRIWFISITSVNWFCYDSIIVIIIITAMLPCIEHYACSSRIWTLSLASASVEFAVRYWKFSQRDVSFWRPCIQCFAFCN